MPGTRLRRYSHDKFGDDQDGSNRNRDSGKRDRDGFRQNGSGGAELLPQGKRPEQMFPRRLLTSKVAGPDCPGFGSKWFRKVTRWLQAQSWKGPQDTAPVRQRAAPPWRRVIGQRTQ